MRARGGTSRRPPHYRCRFPILPPAGGGFNRLLLNPIEMAEQDTRISVAKRVL